MYILILGTKRIVTETKRTKVSFFFKGYMYSVGYVGPDLGSTVSLAKQILVLLALSAIVRGVRTEVSPKIVWEGAGTRFPHPRDVLMKVLEVRDPNLCAALLCAAFCSSQPVCTFGNTVLFLSDPYCAIILVLNLACADPIFLLLIQLSDKRACSKTI